MQRISSGAALARLLNIPPWEFLDELASDNKIPQLNLITEPQTRASLLDRIYKQRYRLDKEICLLKRQWKDTVRKDRKHLPTDSILGNASSVHPRWTARVTSMSRAELIRKCRYLWVLKKLEGFLSVDQKLGVGQQGEVKALQRLERGKEDQKLFSAEAREVREEAEKLYRAILKHLRYNGINITNALSSEIYAALIEELPQLELPHLGRLTIPELVCSLKSKDPRQNFIQKMIQFWAKESKNRKITLDAAKALSKII